MPERRIMIHSFALLLCQLELACLHAYYTTNSFEKRQQTRSKCVVWTCIKSSQEQLLLITIFVSF